MTESATYPDFIASCWTSAGDAAPLRGDETSPIDIRTRIETAARTGWKGFGLLHADLVQIRDSIGLSALRQMFDDNGIEYVELEFLNGWWATGEERTASDSYRDDLFAAVEPLGVHHIKCGAGMGGEPVEWSRFVDGWGELSQKAEAAGVRMSLEAAPFSYLPRIEDGVRLVSEVAHPFGGLIVDIWHTNRGGTDYEQLAKLIPAEYVFGIEIDDAPAEMVGTIFEDTINNRLFCGEGDFNVPAFIRAVQSFGYDGPWGVEMISEDYRHRPIDEAMRLAREAAERCFDRAAEAG